MPKIAFTWAGCKLNRYEIQLMSERLATCAFETVAFGEEADCYVINTCSVTSAADASSRHLIRQARKRAPASKVVVTGCYAELRPEDLNDLGVDKVIRNRDKDRLPEMVLDLFGRNEKASSVPSDANLDPIISGMHGMTRALVKIQDGCDEKCSYCAIWMARGPLRSRSAYSIVKEINKLSENGYHEVVLTGVHIGKYALNGLNLEGLLKTILRETSLDRIRLSSLNPTEVTASLVGLFQSDSRLCPYFHLSIQSGDNEILDAMGRRYTAHQIVSTVDMLMRSIADATIGADFIVGFPGESTANFENTFSLIENNQFHKLHIFPYSDRPGTKASQMLNKIGSGEKNRRTTMLRQLGRRKMQAHLMKFVGRRLTVLVENRQLEKRNFLTGLSANYLRVNMTGGQEIKGNIVRTTPIRVGEGILISGLIDPEA